MLFGLTASPTSFEVPVLDRISDIFVLSLYTIGTTALLLPAPEPPTAGGTAPRSGRGIRPMGRPGSRLRMHQEVTNGNGK